MTKHITQTLIELGKTLDLLINQRERERRARHVEKIHMLLARLVDYYDDLLSPTEISDAEWNEANEAETADAPGQEHFDW